MEETLGCCGSEPILGFNAGDLLLSQLAGNRSGPTKVSMLVVVMALRINETAGRFINLFNGNIFFCILKNLILLLCFFQVT